MNLRSLKDRPYSWLDMKKCIVDAPFIRLTDLSSESPCEVKRILGRDGAFITCRDPGDEEKVCDNIKRATQERLNEGLHVIF